jgi:hypothetical protein
MGFEAESSRDSIRKAADDLHDVEGGNIAICILRPAFCAELRWHDSGWGASVRRVTTIELANKTLSVGDNDVFFRIEKVQTGDNRRWLHKPDPQAGRRRRPGKSLNF